MSTQQMALCPRVAKAMELLGKRWTALIIYQLLQGPQRFNEIEQALPISGRLLSERLKELEQEQIVVRMVNELAPTRGEYTLTDKGLALEEAIRSIEAWSKQWI